MSTRALIQAERDIDRMPHEQHESERYLSALDSYAEAILLEDLISRPENLGEALTEWAGNLTDDELRAASRLIRDKDSAEIGRIVTRYVRRYWLARASGMAAEVMDNECAVCFGRGCQRCESCDGR